MSKAKHTPGPWGSFDKILPDAATDFPCTVITAPNGCALAYIGNHAGYKENAEFILRAANTHDQMLGALKEANNTLSRLYEGRDGGEMPAVVQLIRIAIAKAEGCG